MLVRAMVKKRETIKVWPLIFVCKNTGAVHTEVIYNYRAKAFLLTIECCGPMIKAEQNHQQ